MIFSCLCLSFYTQIKRKKLIDDDNSVTNSCMDMNIKILAEVITYIEKQQLLITRRGIKFNGSDPLIDVHVKRVT